MKQTLPSEYFCLAAFRVFSTIFTQNGYIHPDEFFQTIEIVIGDIFGVVHNRPWEFNTDFPVRSICLLYNIFAMPLYTIDWILKSHNIYISWNPDLLLLVFRLITCAITFITDYSIFKICKLLRLKCNKHLLLLSSSYVIIVFATKTFTNSFELALVSLLLWKVVESITITEEVLIATKEIENTIGCITITDRILRIRALRKLPSHHYKNILEISIILVLGVFNRPTFVLFAVTPLFFWLTRGFNQDFNQIYIRFTLRLLSLLLCIVPGVFLFIVIDSYYYGYITEDEWNLTITPLNFIKYNIDSSNLTKHGYHFRGIHTLINIPILFNILSLLFLRNLQLPAFIHNIRNRQYHLLSNMMTAKTLMVAIVIIPLFLLSMFPHQESRFLIPLLLPIVFCTAKFFSRTYLNHFKYILPVWCFSNIIGLIFYGYLHQAGVTPMVSYLFKEIDSVSKVHIIHSHTYPIPVGLLMVPRFNKNITYITQRNIKVHDLGSVLDPEVLYDTVMNINKNITRNDTTVYFALTGALSKQFESFGNTSSLTYTKQFFPHISMESLGYYLTSIIDLFYYDKNKSSFISLGELDPKSYMRVYKPFALQYYLFVNDMNL